MRALEEIERPEKTMTPMDTTTETKPLKTTSDLLSRLSGGALGLVGWVLSPLCWWSDAVTNIPLAFLFAKAVTFGTRSHPAFEAVFLVGYGLTNVAGFFLLHLGGKRLCRGPKRRYTSRHFAFDTAVSLAYVVGVMVLVRMGLLRGIGLS